MKTLGDARSPQAGSPAVLPRRAIAEGEAAASQSLWIFRRSAL